MNGKPFDESSIYAGVTNNFCASGGDTYHVLNRAYSQGFGFDTGITLDEAVIDCIDDALDGLIGEQYANPAGNVTQIVASAS